eukprot:TRINITY_DN1522_c0_g1_i6.p1 TRINITY_DN1522_c0_g1~~TRINITY_DN1522_c0_g1_i6.p1  ORF type:complete len:604 (-),score=192.12 TRINITY_DN1522_c0_g1_i6:882-2672(-)
MAGRAAAEGKASSSSSSSNNSSAPGMSATRLLVTGLPPSATQQSIEEHFSSYGPIRRAFVITPKGSTECDGRGFVDFAVPADAQQAKACIKHTKFEGRHRLVAVFARKRLRGQAGDSADADAEGPAAKKAAKEKGKPTAATAKPVAAAAMRRPQQAPGSDDEDDGEFDLEAHPEAMAKKKPKAVAIESKKIVIRNLPFKWKENDLEEYVKGGVGAASVAHVTLVRDAQQRSKGYAFVQFTSAAVAKQAVTKFNEANILGRKINVVLALPKDVFDSTKTAPARSSNEKADDADASDDEDSDEGPPLMGASDGETSEKDNKDEEQEDEDEEMEDEEEREEEDEDEDEDEEMDEEEIKTMKKRDERNLPATIFIRNLAFDTTEEQLTERFGSFGEVRYCAIPEDAVKQRSKGCAFLCFKKSESVDNVLAEAYPVYATNLQVKAGTTSTARQQESAIVIGGRNLIITRALRRDEVEQLVTSKKKKKEKSDKRNLHLARVGYIDVKEGERMGLSKNDIRKRQSAFALKNAKLKNPNFFVSPTRLSIRNLPTFVDETKLKDLITKFVEVKGQPPRITKVMVVRDSERADASGQNRSRGCGST